MALQPPRAGSLWVDLCDYFRLDFRRELRGWARVLRYYGVFFPLLMTALVVAVVHADPWPPGKAYLATGQKGSSYFELSQKFAAFFAQHGIELELVETQGLSDGLSGLVSTDSRVNASFMTGGVATPGQYPHMVSLGSLKYSPVWLFYRGSAPRPATALRELLERRIAIGVPGTYSRALLMRMLDLQGIAFNPGKNHFEIPHEEAADRFARGELDAVFIVDGIESATVQRLLKTPDRLIVDFELTDAFLKKMPFLEKVRLPKGSVDLKNVFPAQDITLMTTSVTLVVEKDTHPALQWLYLQAAEHISRDRTEFFSPPDRFPQYLDHAVALSEVGKKYFGSGLPAVFSYLPNTWATLVEGTLGMLVAGLAVSWSLLSRILSWRQFPSGKWLYDDWSALRAIDEQLHKTVSALGVQELIEQLDRLDRQCSETWVDDNVIHQHFALRQTIERVRLQAHAQLQRMQTGNHPTQSPHRA